MTKDITERLLEAANYAKDNYINSSILLEAKKEIERLRAENDGFITRAVAADPDAAPIVDAEWFKGATIVPPQKGPFRVHRVPEKESEA